MTLYLTFGAFVIGAIGGVPLALALRSGTLAVRVISRLLVDFVRGVPIIVWLFVLKFGLAGEGIRFAPLTAGVIGLGLVSAAYLAEIYRGGLQTVPVGQLEAANALGLSRSVTFRRVIAPQAIRIVSPSVATYLMGLFKDSSIASTIIVGEIVFQAQSYARQHPTAVGIIPYIVAGLIYIVLSIPVAYFSRKLDRRMREEIY
ncbi:polar amino acid transport system permease protein [Mycobacterium sp. URHB0021]